jgi:hypothetical protein
MDENLEAAITAHFRQTEKVAAAALAIEVRVEQMDEEGEEGAIHHQQQQEQQTEQPSFLTETYLYKIEDAFSEEDLYWKENVRGTRFNSTLTTGILYRPDIVDSLVGTVKGALMQSTARGIMVKGPQGIGKSHTLVNLVRKLVYDSNNKYLVTFFPDCAKWRSVFSLLDTICASFGFSNEAITKQCMGIDMDAREVVLKKFIATLDGILKSMDKQWVFVFDQINKLFVKPMNLQAKDASGLAFPFFMIEGVMKTGRITSVISASANNEVSYKERHEGFVEYIHRIDMTPDELQAAFGAAATTNIERTVDVTGGVPLYVSLLLSDGEERYKNEITASVQDSLRRLRNFNTVPDWKVICESVYSSLLQSRTDAMLYDKKFFIESERVSDQFKYQSLFPLVLPICRGFLWDDLMAYMQEKETLLLSVCREPDTSNDARGRHFENMVIRRCVQNGVVFQLGGEEISIPGTALSTSFRFSGKQLTSFTLNSPNGVYVPLDPNFPAIDLVWKHGNVIIGVQVHVNKHDDVLEGFISLCRVANLFGQFDIHLIYLSPEDDVMDLVSNLVKPPTKTVSGRSTRSNQNPGQWRVERRAISKNSIACLLDLQWPEGCSLGGTGAN